MRQKIGNPHGVVDVGLAAGDVLDVLGIGQDQFEAALQNVPDRPPVDTGRFHREMCAAVETEPLGQFEQLVLTAVLTLGENAYGVTIHKKVQELAAPKAVTLGAIYVTLDRLEDKGYVTSRLTEPTAARGGRAKRCYRLEASGERALKESIATARRMAVSVAPIWGDPDKELGKA